MVIMRFKVKVRAEQAEDVRAALHAVIEPSRALEGVVHFDIARDLSDPHAFIATEVYDSKSALDARRRYPRSRPRWR